MSVIRAVALSLLVVLLAACGGGATQNGGGGGGDEPASSAGAATPAGGDDGGGGDTSGGADAACIVTAEEVSAALEVEVTDVNGVENPGLGAGCSYAGADGQVFLAVSMITNEQAEGAFESYRDYEGAEELSGIGDAAIYLGPDLPPGVAFIKDGIVYSLGVATAQGDILGGDEAALRQAVEDLARAGAERA